MMYVGGTATRSVSRRCHSMLTPDSRHTMEGRVDSIPHENRSNVGKFVLARSMYNLVCLANAVTGLPQPKAGLH